MANMYIIHLSVQILYILDPELLGTNVHNSQIICEVRESLQATLYPPNSLLGVE